MKLDNRKLAALPKVLLHEHLDGVLRPQTVIDLAKQANYTDLPTGDAAALAHWFDSSGSAPERQVTRAAFSGARPAEGPSR